MPSGIRHEKDFVRDCGVELNQDKARKEGGERPPNVPIISVDIDTEEVRLRRATDLAKDSVQRASSKIDIAIDQRCTRTRGVVGLQFLEAARVAFYQDPAPPVLVDQRPGVAQCPALGSTELDADLIGRSNQFEYSGNDAIFAALRGNIAAESLESDALRFPSIHGGIFKAHYSRPDRLSRVSNSTASTALSGHRLSNSPANADDSQRQKGVFCEPRHALASRTINCKFVIGQCEENTRNAGHQRTK